MKKFIFLTLIITTQSVWAGMWTLSVHGELIEKTDKIKKSVLKFSDRTGHSWTYVPPTYPWGVYSHESTVIGGKAYIVTYWSAGLRSVYYRVFQPDTSESPICEFETETESPKFRSKSGELQYLDIYLQENHKKISVWKKCLPVTPAPSKELASVPAKKSTPKKK